MRVLVADDELVSRKKMEKIMDTLGECVARTSIYNQIPFGSRYLYPEKLFYAQCL